MRHLNRVTPVGPPAAYKTYQVLSPISTHFRPASCAEVDCPAYANGWKTVIDESTDLGKQQAHYITKLSGRRYTREVLGDDGQAVYTFEAGQDCFREHHVRGDRPAIYVVKDGDWRASQNARQHAGADDWLDDFATHQDQLKTRLERG